MIVWIKISTFAKVKNVTNMKIGDKVRFLSEVGGGIVRGFQGKDVALVEGEDGFEIPMLIKECVVIQTDDYNIPLKSAKKPEAPQAAEEEIEEEKPVTYRAPEIRGNDVLNVYLAYVPQDIREISSTAFDAYLVNDSNYFCRLSVSFGRRQELDAEKPGNREAEYETASGRVRPECTERPGARAVQLMAYKDDRTFLMKNVVCQELRIDTVKFYKLHTFEKNDFFPEPALIYDIVRDDETARQVFVSAEDIKDALIGKKGGRGSCQTSEERSEGEE